MVCILLNKDDQRGLWLSRLLQQTGRKDIKLISAEELVYAPDFSCGFKNGKAFFNITLPNKFVFSNDTVSKIINRIQYLPLQHLQQFKEEDRLYVEAEFTATFTFLFSILPGNIFNQTTGMGFCGRRRSQLEWLLLAQKAGFEKTELLYQNKELYTEPVSTKSEIKSILFFNNKYYGSEDNNEAGELCMKLGQLSGEKILEIYFNATDNKLFFVEAKTTPSFQNADIDFITDLNNQL
jgi:hypothetical protein